MFRKSQILRNFGGVNISNKSHILNSANGVREKLIERERRYVYIEDEDREHLNMVELKGIDVHRLQRHAG